MDYSQPLSFDQLHIELSAVMRGQRDEAQMESFLRTLAERGETSEEIAAAVAVLRENAVKLSLSTDLRLCDTCGTGGDGFGTMNFSTVTALVSAAAGAKICKHGNRAASSKCGSADVLDALGVRIDAAPDVVAKCIQETGFGFCFAPAFHPAMKVVMPVRRKIGSRTLFNLVGPLANPAPLTYQLLGVAQAEFMRPMAEALIRLNVRRAMVVHGEDGMDEITTTAKTRVLEIGEGVIREQSLDSQSLGFSPSTIEDLKGGDAKTNAEIAHGILKGQQSAYRDMVLLNTGTVLYLSEQASDIPEGIRLAAKTIDSGQAEELLNAVVTLTGQDAA